MTLYELKAWESRHVEVADQHVSGLAGSGLARIAATAQAGVSLLETGSRVGVAIGDGWEVRVHPRLDIPKLLFLLAYSRNPAGWKSTVAGFDVADDLFSAVASGFAHHAEEAVRLGVLHGYVPLDDRLAALRGRVRFADQLARALPLPLEVSYEDFTANVTENRMLRTAGELLLRFPRVPMTAARRLVRLRAVLDDVDVLTDAGRVKSPPVTRLNERYAPALALAELILQGSSIGAQHGRVSSVSFAFDMNEVFESFLYAALKDAFRHLPGHLQRHRSSYLDIAETALRLEPDATWVVSGRPRAVIDAKYKSLVSRDAMPNADAYQMLAYCVGLGLPRGTLIYAKDAGEQPRSHIIKRHGYEIDVRAVDVELEPDALLEQVSSIARSIAATGAASQAVA